MECTLPGWASYAGMIAMIVVAGGSAFGVFSWLSRIGERRHPGITFGDQHSRTLWNSAGLALGVFVVFPVVAVVFLDVIRAPMCETVGEYRHPPPRHAFDFEAIQHDIDAMLREFEGRH